MNAITAPQTFDIEGERKSPWQIHSKVLWALALASGGIYLIFCNRDSWNDNNELGGWSIVVGFLMLVSAPFLPPHKHVYLDFANRRIVTKAYYAWFCRSCRIRPLTDFGTIVVRHLCIPGGEGPDTYTGSVGLKPLAGKTVFWVRNFPATEDDFPSETHEFAKSLAVWTGLPRVQGDV